MKVVMTARLIAGAMLSSLVLCAYAQSTGPLAVEERSLSQAQSQVRSTSTSSAAVNEGGLMVLMQQQQQYEEQIQQLQGQLEELRHELSTLKKAERERYLDLDTRINTLAERGTTEQPEAGAEGDNDPEADRAAYNIAKDKLVRGDFKGAIAGFEAYLKEFPQGLSRANAHFWAGKLYSDQKEPDLKKAKSHFQAVADDYPDHSKAPKSLYILAVMQAKAGETSPAKVSLHKLIKQYPDSKEADQAKGLLDQLNK